MDVTGNGDPGSPYVIDVVIDDEADNQLSCVDTVDGGLYVPPASVEVGDTFCIGLSGTGFPGDPITADPILDTVDPGNLLSCGADGLAANVNTDVSDCVALSGAGTLGDPLVAEIAISLDPGNVITCESDGLYAPAASTGAIDIFGRIGLATAFSSSAGVGTVNFNFPYDVVDQDMGGITDIANSQMVVPVGGDGWYQMQLMITEEPPFGDSYEGSGATEYYWMQLGFLIDGTSNEFLTRFPLFVNLGVATTFSALMYLNAGQTVEGSVLIASTNGAAAIGARAYYTGSGIGGLIHANHLSLTRVGV